MWSKFYTLPISSSNGHQGGALFTHTLKWDLIHSIRGRGNTLCIPQLILKCYNTIHRILLWWSFHALCINIQSLNYTCTWEGMNVLISSHSIIHSGVKVASLLSNDIWKVTRSWAKNQREAVKQCVLYTFD